MDYDYWLKQTPAKPLFPDIEWSKPEQLSQRGRLGVVGGNKLGFAGVAESYSTALEAGAGQVRVILPDALKKTVPAIMTDVIFTASNPSGSLAHDALGELIAIGQWAGVVLLAGDAGRNSETAITYSNFLSQSEVPVVITRDAVDLVRNDPQALVARNRTTLVISFAQLQKLFQAVYYPIVLTFSMQLLQLVEALHKFTITYPTTVAVLHRETMLVAHGGRVTTTAWSEPMLIWRGVTAARIATYQLWTPGEPLEAATASLLSKK